MEVNIIDKNEFKVIGIEIRTTNAGGKCVADCGAIWGRFFSESILDKIPNKVNPSINYGLYTDYEENFSITDGFYSYIVCTEVSSLDIIPEGMVGKTIPASKYARLTTEGPFPQKLGEAWQYIWNRECWGEEYKRAFDKDFEVYDTSRYMNQENPEMDIYLSIK